MKKMAPVTIDPMKTSWLSGQAMISHGHAAPTTSASATAAHCQGGGMRMRPSPITVRARSDSLADGQMPPIAHQACAMASRISASDSTIGRVMCGRPAGSLTLHFPGQQRQIADAHQQAVWRIVPPVARCKRLVAKMAAPSHRIARHAAGHEHTGDDEGDGLYPGLLVATQHDEGPDRHGGQKPGHGIALPGGR